MDLWLVFLLLAVVCAVIGWWRSRPKKGGLSSHSADPPHMQGGLVNYRPDVPTVWSETEISRQLATLQSQPEILPHYIDALKQRFILKTDDRTAQVRTQFLRSHIEQMELGKQYQSLVNDLRSMETEQENRLLRLKLEQHELRAKTKQAIELQDIRLQKERLAAEVEVEELKAKKRELRKPPRASGPNADQQRRLRRIEIEDKLRELDRLEEEALKHVSAADDRIRVENMYADKREELRDQLSKNLV